MHASIVFDYISDLNVALVPKNERKKSTDDLIKEIKNRVKEIPGIKTRVNPIGIRSCYDEGKRCAETLFFDYNRQHNLDIKVVRIFNTYGPRMHPNDGRVVSNFIVQALQGKDITIYGHGQQTRSFCYVDDLIDAMVRMMNSEQGFAGPVNIGNPGEFTMLQLAETVLKLSGSKSKIIHQPLPSDDPKQRQPNIELAKAKLGWQPKVNLEDGLKETIAYFRKIVA